MRKRTASLILIALGLAVVLVPSATTAEKERVGTRISLFAGSFQVFPASQPFHIAHGWGLSPHDPAKPAALGKYGFSLAVDGVERQADFVDKGHVENPDFGRLQSRIWVHNFPDGMTGTHTFTGHWFGPCAALVASGFAPGPCEHPAETTTSVGPPTVTVVFVP